MKVKIIIVVVIVYGLGILSNYYAFKSGVISMCDNMVVVFSMGKHQKCDPAIAERLINDGKIEWEYKWVPFIVRIRMDDMIMTSASFFGWWWITSDPASDMLKGDMIKN